MELPVPDPEKLLASWMEWETGENTPGRVMANLKTGGLPDLLEAIIAAKADTSGSAAAAPAADAASAG
jgi:hypothetical protein